MSVDSWQPITPATQLDTAQIEQLLNLSQLDHDNLTAELDWIQPLVHAKAEIWQQTSQNLSAEQLVSLIRFFTQLEKTQNWDLAGASPVIPLFKAYKQQHGVDRELVKWVKSHTDNKYLPFGPLV
ncbi:hypothetical protein [Bermanella sp. R86510]|uniref:hypothetical protein n=1 Tax=unclassified Bermanella TaxID=2627862 RepID=UPI0037C9423C